MTNEQAISDALSLANTRARGTSLARRRTKDPRRPAARWVAKSRIGAGIGSALSVVLSTVGCSHARGESGGCTMCSYLLDGSSKSPSSEELVMQFKSALRELQGLGSPLSVKVYTSGSFFDEEEVPSDARGEILELISQDERIEEVVFESRPEFVTERIVSELSERLDGRSLELGIGLESSNDRIRSLCVNKGFTFEDFVTSVRTAEAHGIGVRSYVLLKPPFLTERDSILDAIRTIDDALQTGVTTISLNPVNVQKKTLVETLWKHDRYRPPWLWSVLEVLKSARASADDSVNIICDPVAAGKSRGAHNCGKCDESVVTAIRLFALNQDLSLFDGLHCDCKELWSHTKEHEDVALLVHR